MTWRTTGIYRAKANGTFWTPLTDPTVWQGEEVPAVVTLRAVDEQGNPIILEQGSQGAKGMIRKAEFEADYEDTGNDVPSPQESAEFE